MATVHVRRIYEDPSADDGARFLVDRLWPRGVSRERADLTEWLKEVAPSTELRKWYSHDPDKYDEFARRYRAELREGEAAEALNRLLDYAEKGPLTMLTASKQLDLSHTTVLEDVIAEA